ncbi:PLP-dependent aminotransferase family protein [Halomonas sp. G11]|uniref:aminotransferase-like domain-containing protein n=1 Tax=Halomonas sp. G11 TaxID=1684425 RepID=UPI0007FE3A5B|nr:PLP-dependent aminotransferase family protein [Halomonas sp. G11]OAZ96721.1 GntR family transcriptional regulator [Halomonas sp. G11]
MGVNKNNDMVSFICDVLATESGPKYRRLALGIEREIREGRLPTGTKLPAHRLLADQVHLTAGTISRAYQELERLGLVSSRVGDGTYVKMAEENAVAEEGFRNALNLDDSVIDLSRNKHIQGRNVGLLGNTLAEMASQLGMVAELCDYTQEGGLYRHREAGALWFWHSQVEAKPEQVICTNGAQHALMSCLLAIVRSGESVATEQLSYPGLISASRLLGFRSVGVDIDEQGLVPESLDDVCSNNRISALYCTPTLQNPTTSIMSAERREAVATVCRKHNLIIIEDDAHGLLASERPPALQVFAPERTLLISSLSKAVSAGLRVGYIYAPEALWHRLAAAIRASCWMATPLSLEIASNWILDGTASHLRCQQIEEVRRRKALVEPLLNDLNYQSKRDCSHFWIEIPEPFRAIEIEEQLRQKQILVKSSESFAVGRKAVPQFIRASVSSARWDEQLNQGFQTLAAALNDLPREDLMGRPDGQSWRQRPLGKH